MDLFENKRNTIAKLLNIKISSYIKYNHDLSDLSLCCARILASDIFECNCLL